MNQNPNAEKACSQTALILAYLKQGHALTPLQAMAEPFRCMRLGARILDLKHAGHKIDSRIITTSTGKRIASYSLAPRETPSS